MSSASWTHLAARPLVRPLIGTWVRPNHLTTLRLLSGLAACAGFALGSRQGMNWGGALWLVSAFLDRADGELARLGNLASPGGHFYDYTSDLAVNAGFFLCIGIGLRHGWLGVWAVALGLAASASFLIGHMLSERLESLSPPDTPAYAGKWGFDPDDALYLMGPFAWLGWLSPILVGAAIATPAIMVLTGLRVRRAMRAVAAGQPA